VRIFVTGGDGFVGRHLLPYLQSQGHRVTALAGEPSSPEILRALGAHEIVPGRLELPNPWLPKLAGHDAVIHLAAPVLVWGPWEMFYTQMVLATQKLYEAAVRYRVPRFIYTSSETVHWGYEVRSLVGIDEDAPFARRPYSHYSRAKQMVERYLQTTTEATQPLILRLPFVWGPGSKFLEVLEAQVRAGRFAWIGDPDMPIEALHVDNAVAALALALEGGHRGRAYFVTDEHPHTLRTFLGGIIQALGLPVPTRQMSPKVLAALTALAEGVWRVLPLQGSPWPMTRFELAFFTLPRRYRTGRARTELGYRPSVDWQAGLMRLAP